jgi:hypothetical protein
MSHVVREDLDTKRQRWLSILLNFQNTLYIDPQFPRHLYHYSSLAGIRGILNSKSIWLSDILLMNDEHDGKYWSIVFRDVQRKKSVPPIIRDPFERGSGVGIGSAYYSYIACFSPEYNLDSQWKHYADEGRGCALEFSFEAVRDNADGGKAYGWTPMEYDEDVQREQATRTIDFAIDVLRRERTDLTRQEVDEYWKCAAFSYLVCGTRFKRPTYSSEKEWRIFMSRPTRDGASYRTGTNGQIPYLTLPLASNIVTGLIKGPACACDYDDLRRCLNDAGYSATLRTHSW